MDPAPRHPATPCTDCTFRCGTDLALFCAGGPPPPNSPVLPPLPLPALPTAATPATATHVRDVDIRRVEVRDDVRDVVGDVEVRDAEVRHVEVGHVVVGQVDVGDVDVARDVGEVDVGDVDVARDVGEVDVGDVEVGAGDRVREFGPGACGPGALELTWAYAGLAVRAATRIAPTATGAGTRMSLRDRWAEFAFQMSFPTGQAKS